MGTPSKLVSSLMDAITIRIRATEDEQGYMFEVYDGDAIDGPHLTSLGPCTDDGGQCTTTMKNALGMAVARSERLITRELGDECPGCWKDMSCRYSRMHQALGFTVCPSCHERADIEGDFIGKR